MHKEGGALDHTQPWSSMLVRHVTTRSPTASRGERAFSPERHSKRNEIRHKKSRLPEVAVSAPLQARPH